MGESGEEETFSWQRECRIARERGAVRGGTSVLFQRLDGATDDSQVERISSSVDTSHKVLEDYYLASAKSHHVLPTCHSS